MNIINKMREIQDLTPAERQVINYILSNPSTALKYKLAELSKETYSSMSTITRLCHKLGAKNFSEFRLNLALEINSYLISSRDIRQQYPFNKEDSVSQIVEKSLTKNAFAISEILNINSMQSLLEVVDLVHNAKQIDFYGRGTSNIVAIDMVYKALRLGKRATAYTKTGEMIMNSRISTSENIAFLISYSGETPEILEVCENLNFRGVQYP